MLIQKKQTVAHMLTTDDIRDGKSEHIKFLKSETWLKLVSDFRPHSILLIMFALFILYQFGFAFIFSSIIFRSGL